MTGILAAAAVSAVLMTAAGWGYLGQVRRGAAHPRLASWVIWSCSMGIAAAGAGVTGQVPAVALAGAGAAGCAAVLVMGWRRGTRSAGWLDWAGLSAGAAGLACWGRRWPGRG
jgi:hypothetical protein